MIMRHRWKIIEIWNKGEGRGTEYIVGAAGIIGGYFLSWLGISGSYILNMHADEAKASARTWRTDADDFATDVFKVLFFSIEVPPSFAYDLFRLPELMEK